MAFGLPGFQTPHVIRILLEGPQLPIFIGTVTGFEN